MRVDFRGGPVAQTHDQKFAIAQEISDRLRHHYQSQVKAVGLFGSVARGADGPYSDVELFCILEGQGIEKVFEWAAGPWKALVNVYSEDIILRDAAIVDGTWPLVQSGYVYTKPLYDPTDLFLRVREIALASASSDFEPSVRDLILGEIYENVGKVRNARERNPNALPMLCVEIAKACACMIALANRHMYVSASNFLDESMALPDRPEGYDDLCKRVISGALSDFKLLGECVDRLWSGIEVWAVQRDIQIYEGLDSLLE